MTFNQYIYPKLCFCNVFTTFTMYKDLICRVFHNYSLIHPNLFQYIQIYTELSRNMEEHIIVTVQYNLHTFSKQNKQELG